MKDQTEEKALPASPKKLRDARRKGQVSHSKDLVAGFGLLVAVFYLLYDWPVMRDHVTELLNVVTASVDQPFAETRQRAIMLALQVLWITSAPLAMLVFVGSVAAGMAGTLGPVFSFENVKLKFEHIDPVQGAKRIFSLRNVVEFTKAVTKVLVLTVAFWLVLRGFMQSLFETPSCGETCLGAVVVSTLKPLALTAAIVFVSIGVLDTLLQHRLFLRDMRMTRTERKRELKDLEGDPLIRSERRRLRHQVMVRPGRVGMRQAVVVITHGDRAVGLRYHQDDAPVPVVVGKAQGHASEDMLAEARRLGIPITEDGALVDRLINRHAIGDRIRQDLYSSIAELLVRIGL